MDWPLLALIGVVVQPPEQVLRPWAVRRPQLPKALRLAGGKLMAMPMRLGSLPRLKIASTPHLKSL